MFKKDINFEIIMVTYLPSRIMNVIDIHSKASPWKVVYKKPIRKRVYLMYVVWLRIKQVTM